MFSKIMVTIFFSNNVKNDGGKLRKFFFCVSRDGWYTHKERRVESQHRDKAGLGIGSVLVFVQISPVII